MNSFEHIHFNGTFRNYQQQILDEAGRFLEDGKIHVVASPGSGKTVLGLELIRRLGKPALILSPTVTIRQQWGQRFSELFLPEGRNAGDVLSFRLKFPSLLTSVTYQALHAAWTKQATPDPEDDEDGDRDDSYEGFDLAGAVRAAGIRTVCLDEAHHLRSEWQKALEEFIRAIEHDVTVISLTATPPYDSSPAEWKRYIKLCGEIDEEIFVPELVKQQTLCPHQDYIMFTYPGDRELDVISGRRKKASEAINGIIRDGLLDELLNAGGLTKQGLLTDEQILDHEDGYVALACLAKYKGVRLAKRLVSLLRPGRWPVLRLKQVQTAFQFVLDNPGLFGGEPAARLKQALNHAHLFRNGNVRLVNDDVLNKLLVTSTGKLTGIARIAQEEEAQMEDGLRMLVLTDFIRKDLLHLVGTDLPVNDMGTVPIFETIRRSVGCREKIALLSGTLVLCADACVERVREITDRRGLPFTSRPLRETGFSQLRMGGSNKHKVAVMTEAFEQGIFTILVGTKSLLGEGWDSPCINSLVLASFVGSFVLSNQMRGRAIRINPRQPGKTANIWHLATVEPPDVFENDPAARFYMALLGNRDVLVSADFDMLRRRFECFMGPAYHSDYITSGVERLDIIVPPFNKKGIDRINRQMLELAADRDAMARRWATALQVAGLPEVMLNNDIPARILPTRFTFVYLLNAALASAILGVFLYTAGGHLMSGGRGLPGIFLGIAVYAGLFFVIASSIRKMLKFLMPDKTIAAIARALLSALRELGDITSPDAAVSINPDASGLTIRCGLRKATVHEKNVFCTAIGELLSPIGNPRYVLVREDNILGLRFPNYAYSYACPSVIGGNQDRARVFERSLKRHFSSCRLFYTRSEDGRKRLLKSRRLSMINLNGIYLKRMMRWG